MQNALQEEFHSEIGVFLVDAKLAIYLTKRSFFMLVIFIGLYLFSTNNCAFQTVSWFL